MPVSDVINDRYQIGWVGRCKWSSDSTDTDKIWGWFFYLDPTSPLPTTSKPKNGSTHRYSYVFWGRTGKNLNFKRHAYSPWAMNSLVENKKNNSKYSQITVDEFKALWLDLFDTMHNRFIFHLLADNI